MYVSGMYVHYHVSIPNCQDVPYKDWSPWKPQIMQKNDAGYDENKENREIKEKE